MTTAVETTETTAARVTAMFRHSRPVDYRDEIIGQAAPLAPFTEHARDLSAAQVGDVLGSLRLALCWQPAEAAGVGPGWNDAYTAGFRSGIGAAIEHIARAVQLSDYLDAAAAGRGRPRTVATRDQLDRLGAALDQVAAAAAELGFRPTGPCEVGGVA